MTSWFTTKKVEGSATLSEKLIDIRKERSVDLDVLSSKTKITKKYLVYLEEGRLDKLPAEIYVKGFLKKIADFYNIDSQEFTRLYGKEESIRKNIDKSKYPPFNLNRSPTFIITPRTITFIAISIVIISFMIFLIYQMSFIVKGPKLTIDSPGDDIITDKSAVLVSGSLSDSDAVVSINGEVINLKDGKISELVNLTPGLNMIRISATNKFKKSNTIIKKVILKKI